jgi:general secretion pathway protein C
VNTQRLAEAGDKLDEIWQQFAFRLQTLSDPVRQRRLKLGLCGLAAVWMVFALASLLWGLLPPSAPAPMPTEIINPLQEPVQQAARTSVNIEELAGWELFGSAAAATQLPLEDQAATADGLDGIEADAQETRLNLKLQGIVASTVSEEARAIIESKNKQEQYAVGDELPVGRGVKVAKILTDRVVIDNKGTYELLLLFDESSLAVPKREPARAPATAGAVTARMDRRGDQDITELAQTYRQRLYTNPQSLAQIVSISPHREDGQLKGYKVRPGRDREQFEALGFKANDIVTGVNGITLTDPGKPLELYRVMRTASEASFEVERDGRQLNLVVGLGSPEAVGQVD